MASSASSSHRAPSQSRLHVTPGVWDPAGDEVAGFWIVGGLVQREVCLQRSISVDLLGPQDLVVLDGAEEDLLGARVALSALTHVEAVAFDARMLRQLQGRPDVMGQLLRHAGAQYRRMALHRAVAQLPRVEERLLAMMWLLAERWGRVSPEGVLVPLKLGHEVLGRLVGARRPTISLALKGLSADGKLTRRPDGTWLVDPATQEDLGVTVPPPRLQTYLLDQPAELQAGFSPSDVAWARPAA